MRNKGKQATTHQTINGRVRVRRTVYWSAETGPVVPSDRWLGIVDHRFSPGVREMCCRESLHCSFEVASDNLHRTAQVGLSGRTMRTIVENQGRAVLAAQRSGSLCPGFTVSDCTEKTIISGTDGAEWIANPYRQQLPMLDEHILDYYHLQEHVVKTSQVLYGEGTKKAENWREDIMGCVWEQGSLVMLHRLGPYLRRHRGGAKREALESLRDYVGKRVAMTDYPTFRALGYDCGSGPTESLCGTLTDRLKGSGMRWDKDNAESIMALAALYPSGLWQNYWKAQRAAA